MNIYEQKKANIRSSWVIIAVFVLFFVFIGLGIDRYYGAGVNAPIYTVIAFLIAMISSYAGYRNGDKLVLRSTHARELDLGDPKQKQWQNIVEPCRYVVIKLPRETDTILGR